MQTFHITDRVYGEIEINEPVIISLVRSAPFQRLKGVNQNGTNYLLQHIHYDITRYEHSIGVWYLSQRYGAPVDEQVAALLHDVSHTAFSHVIDYAYRGDKHEFADKRLNRFVRTGEIAQILIKYGLDPNKVIDKTLYPMLNIDLPDLSVDRLDYSFRDAQPDHLLPLSFVKEILNHIYYDAAHGFYFDDIEYASAYTVHFATLCRTVLIMPDGRGSYQILADCMKYTLENKLLHEDDLFVSDDELIQKLKSLHDQTVDKCLARLHRQADFQYNLTSTGEIHGVNKIRIVDPLVKVKGKYIRVSSQSKVIRDMMKDFRERYSTVDIDQIT